MKYSILGSMPIRKAQNILFDADGVLFKSHPLIIEGYRQAFRTVGAECPSDEALRRFCGPPLMANLKSALGEASPLLEPARQAFRAYHDNPDNWKLLKLYPGVKGMLEHLKDVGIKLFVATSKPTEPTIALLRHTRILRNFEGVYGSDMAGKAASKAEIIETLIKTECENGHVINQNNTLMIGDHDVDSLGAMKAAGLRTIGAAWGYSRQMELYLAGVMATLRKPEQLPRYVRSAKITLACPYPRPL